MEFKSTALYVPKINRFDEWNETCFHNNNGSGLDAFVGQAISSGTINASIPTASIDGIHWGGIFMRSSTTANGGYRLNTASTQVFFGQKSFKFIAVALWRTSFTGRTIRAGVHNSQSSADATNGAYFEILDNIVSAKTANNSVRTTHGTTYTLSLDVFYRFEIDVAADGLAVQYRIYNDTTDALLYDQTITTNIPITAARAASVALVATEVSTTASDMIVLSRMGFGTINGYLCAKGFI